MGSATKLVKCDARMTLLSRLGPKTTSHTSMSVHTTARVQLLFTRSPPSQVGCDCEVRLTTKLRHVNSTISHRQRKTCGSPGLKKLASIEENDVFG